MIFKIALTAFLAAMFLFIALGVKPGFSNKIRLLLRLSVVVLLVVIILTFFARKVL